VCQQTKTFAWSFFHTTGDMSESLYANEGYFPPLSIETDLGWRSGCMEPPQPTQPPSNPISRNDAPVDCGHQRPIATNECRPAGHGVGNASDTRLCSRALLSGLTTTDHNSPHLVARRFLLCGQPPQFSPSPYWWMSPREPILGGSSSCNGDHLFRNRPFKGRGVSGTTTRFSRDPGPIRDGLIGTRTRQPYYHSHPPSLILGETIESCFDIIPSWRETDLM
jgi:hypothetical protein